MNESDRGFEAEGIRIGLKAFGTLLQYIGLAVFGIVLGLIILFSVLGVGFITELSFGLIVGVALIGIGAVMERISE